LAKPSSEDSSIEEEILRLVERENPESIRQLLDLAKAKLAINEKEAIQHIQQLITEKRIWLNEPLTPAPRKPKEYLFSSRAYWFWTVIALSVGTAIAVFTVSEDAYPAVYLRNILGSVFVLWLLGYVFIKALFPSEVPIKASSENLQMIERVALSFCMSLVLVPIVGLVLNYTPWGITLTPIILSLLSLTVVFAIVALSREYKAVKMRAEMSS
jgi:hypothetical protein